MNGSLLHWSLAAWFFTCMTVIGRVDEASADPVESATESVVIELFIRGDSEQCTRASEFLDHFASRRGGIEAKVYDVTNDRTALSRLWQLSRKFGLAEPRLPTFYLCDRMCVGFVDDATSGRAIEELLTIHAFLRSGCGHCRAAKAFLTELQRQWPGIRVQEYDIVYDPQAQARMMELSRRFQMPATTTPAFYAADRFIVGFQGVETTGKELQDIFRNRLLPPETRPAERSPRRVTPPPVKRALQRTESGQSPTHGLPALTSSLVGDGFPMFARYQSPTTLDPADREQTNDDAALPPEMELSIPPEASEATSIQSEMPSPPRESIELPWWGEIRVDDFGLPVFTLLVGLVDGFNPCAMWVLVFVLSVLVNLKDRRKILVVAGTFVVVSGLAYFAFMAAWLNVFRLMGLQRPVQLVLGGLGILIGAINIKDFFAFRQGISLSIPESLKPGIYQRVRDIVSAQALRVALAGAITLAVIVNVIEILCTAGLPALYTQILTLQGLPRWQEYAYLGLYNLAYMFDDAVLLAIVVATLSKRRLQEREGRWLKLVSGLVVLLLGLLLVFRPEWLSFVEIP